MSQQRELLEPFSAKAIKTLPGSYSASYVSWTDKIQRLIQVGGAYDWMVVNVFDSGDEKEPVAVHGRLTLNVDGTDRTVDGIGQGRDAKNASSDAFSRACAFLGLGLHLWCAGGDKDSGYWITGVLDKAAE